MKKGLIITIIVILVLLVLGLGGYIVVDKLVLNKNTKSGTTEKTKKETDEIEEAKSISTEEAKELLKEFGFEEKITCQQGILNSEYSEEFKALYVITKIKNEYGQDYACSDLFDAADINGPSNPVVGMSDGSVYKGISGVCPVDESTTIVPYDEVNNTYKKLYGTDIPKKSYNGTKVAGMYYHFYDYLESKNAFVSLNCTACGGSCGPSITIYDIVSATEKDDTLTVAVRYYYSSVQVPYEPFTLKTSKIDTVIECSAREECESKLKEQYLDQLDIYNIKFTTKDGNYIFKSVEKQAA